MTEERMSLEETLRVLRSYEPTLWERIWWPVHRFFRGGYYNVRNGLYGLFYWAPFAWKWRSWDWEWGYGALDHHLAALEVAVREGCHFYAEDTAREIRVARELIRRIQDRDGNMVSRYYDEDMTYKQSKMIEDGYWDMLHSHLRKHARKWWD